MDMEWWRANGTQGRKEEVLYARVRVGRGQVEGVVGERGRLRGGHFTIHLYTRAYILYQLKSWSSYE